jgi:hypothetical protein
MKRYYRIENGIRKWFKNVLVVDGMQIINPSEEQLINAGYVEFVHPIKEEPTEEELLRKAKEEKLKRLHEYDSSKSVNVCYIRYGGQSISYWADKHERDALKSAIRDYIALGKTEYRLDLREMGFSITLSCELLLQMLAALEVYATECYNKTTDHEFAIKSLTTKDEMEAYDFTVGYPEKIVFNLDGDEQKEEVKDVTKGEIIEEEVENGLD